MARRRQHEDSGMNLDSLMDALTNVVAVLILVLVLVQADATKKVEMFLEALEPATEEEIAESGDAYHANIRGIAGEIGKRLPSL